MHDLRQKDVARTMLEDLFGDAVENHGMRFGVCHRGNFAGQWFDQLDKGLSFALKAAGRADVWMSVGVRSEPPEPDPETGETRRGFESEIEGIVALWADLDVADPVHKKAERLPSSYDDAVGLAKTVFHDVKPSVIVDSGHGVQAWWLLDEPWIFESDDEREEARTLSIRFSATLKMAAAEKGWVVDSVFDLSRVMRLPGTVNRKVDDDLKPVRILERNELRWTRDDIDAVCVAEEFMPDVYAGPKPLESVGLIDLNPNASPPVSKFAALMANIEEAKLAFDNNRVDMTDQTASSYDMALANYAARAHWSDQEIANLLIAHRRERGHDMKTSRGGQLRLDYYQRTIAKARAGVARENVTSELNADASTAPIAAGATVKPEERAKILRDASHIFGVPVARFVQFGSGEDATYILELEDESTITIGPAKTIMSQKTWQAKLFPVSRRLFEQLKPKGFVTLVNSLGAIVEYEDNPESDRFQQVTDLLTQYIASSLAREEEDQEYAARSSMPFLAGGQLHISRSGFEAWVKASQVLRVNIDDVWVTLRKLKFKQKTVRATVGGRRVSRRYWASPIDECGEQLGIQDVSKELLKAKPEGAE